MSTRALTKHWQLRISAKRVVIDLNASPYLITITARCGTDRARLEGVIHQPEIGLFDAGPVRQNEFLLDSRLAEHLVSCAFDCLRIQHEPQGLGETGSVQVGMEDWLTTAFGDKAGLAIAQLIKTAALTFGPEDGMDSAEEGKRHESHE